MEDHLSSEAGLWHFKGGCSLLSIMLISFTVILHLISVEMWFLLQFFKEIGRTKVRRTYCIFKNFTKFLKVSYDHASKLLLIVNVKKSVQRIYLRSLQINPLFIIFTVRCIAHQPHLANRAAKCVCCVKRLLQQQQNCK